MFEDYNYKQYNKFILVDPDNKQESEGEDAPQLLKSIDGSLKKPSLSIKEDKSLAVLSDLYLDENHQEEYIHGITDLVSPEKREEDRKEMMA